MSRANINSSFFYIANKSSGGKAFGVRTARSQRALGAALRKDRQILVKTWKLPDWASNEQDMSLKDHAEFDAQLAQLLERGVPLTEALEVASTVVGSANEDRILRLRTLVAQGTSFSDACAQVGSFDEVTCAVYKAAEKTGDLAGACAQLSIGAKRRLEVSGKAATLMIYPCIVLAIAFIAGLVMMTLVVPTIGESMASSGIEVPTFTKILVTAGSFLRANIIILIGVIVVTVVVMFLWRSTVGKLAVSLTRNMPFVRDVVLEQELTRFFSVMGSMTRSGIVLSDAIAVSSGVIGHPKLSKDLQRLQLRLIEGGIFRTLIEQVSALPLATRKLLVAADQAGDLESAFDSLAKDHAKNVDKKTARLMALLEPVLIVILFLIVGTMILAIMLPMMNMTGSVL
ncbi:MAG: type II secretion system F family protein [Phycisphaerales bacterium]|nr:type II secretion system F family protein [Phycisphaerales bacterium]